MKNKQMISETTPPLPALIESIFFPEERHELAENKWYMLMPERPAGGESVKINGN